MAHITRIEKLNERNFHTWKNEARYALAERNLLDIVETPPAGPLANWTPEQKTKNTNAWLLLNYHISNGERHYMDDTKTAAECWDDIKRANQGTSRARRQHLDQAFTDLRMYDDETIAAYFARMAKARSDLVDAGEMVTADKFKYRLIGGLPDRYYGVAHAKIDHYMAPDTTVAEMLGDLQIYEAHTERNGKRKDDNKGPGLSASHETRRCYYCHRVGHVKADCPKLRGEKCGYCGKMGHDEDACHRKKNDWLPTRTGEMTLFGN